MSKQRKRRTAAQRQAEHQQLLERRAQRLAAEEAEVEAEAEAETEAGESAGETAPEPAVREDVRQAVARAMGRDEGPGPASRDEAPQAPEEAEDLPFEVPSLPGAPASDADEEDEEARRAYEEGRAAPARDSGELPDWRAITEEVKRSQARRQPRADAPAPRREPADPERLDREARETAMSDMDRAAAAFAPARRKARKSGLRGLALFAAALAVLFAVLSGASLFLYNKYNPEQFVRSVVDSLAEGGSGLASLAVSDDLTALDADALAPLARYFADDAARDTLAAQLADQVVDPEGPGAAFPALGVEKTPVFLGYCDYKLRVDAVELVVTSSAQNLLLNLDGQPRTGQPTAEGVLYQGLVPGRYTAQVTAADATGQQVTGTETTLDLLDSQAPAAFSGALPIGDLTITGCTSDEAVIAVNGVQVSQRPEDGVVKLQQIALGSTVTFTYTQDWGAVTTGSAVFTDAAVTDLSFGNITTTGGIPASTEVDLMLGAYYASVLNGRNSGDAALLTGLTESWRQEMAGRFAGEEAGGRVYTYTNAVCLPASLALHTEGELPAFRATVAMAYTYSEDAGPAVPAVLYQAVEFVYENGGWLVNRAVDIDEAAFNAGSTAALQPAADASAAAPAA